MSPDGSSRRSTSCRIVFAHGDAAAWNVLVQPNARVAFLDWEAADAEGMPLSDVFHFARSHVIGRARSSSARRPGVLLRSIVEDEGLRSTVAAYTARLRIDPALVAPLMTLCWAHRALREVTRLEAPQLDASHYLGLMNASLDARAQPTWTDRRGVTRRRCANAPPSTQSARGRYDPANVVAGGNGGARAPQSPISDELPNYTPAEPRLEPPGPPTAYW